MISGKAYDSHVTPVDSKGSSGLGVESDLIHIPVNSDDEAMRHHPEPDPDNQDDDKHSDWRDERGNGPGCPPVSEYLHYGTRQEDEPKQHHGARPETHEERYGVVTRHLPLPVARHECRHPGPPSADLGFIRLWRAAEAPPSLHFTSAPLR